MFVWKTTTTTHCLDEDIEEILHTDYAWCGILDSEDGFLDWLDVVQRRKVGDGGCDVTTCCGVQRGSNINRGYSPYFIRLYTLPLSSRNIVSYPLLHSLLNYPLEKNNVLRGMSILSFEKYMEVPG